MSEPMSDEKLEDLKLLVLHWRSKASVGEMTPRSHAGRFLGETCDEIDRLRAENASLRAKMATMICGECKNKRRVPINRGVKPDKDGFVHAWKMKPCPVCQPKEGT